MSNKTAKESSKCFCYFIQQSATPKKQTPLNKKVQHTTNIHWININNGNSFKRSTLMYIVSELDHYVSIFPLTKFPVSSLMLHKGEGPLCHQYTKMSYILYSNVNLRFTLCPLRMNSAAQTNPLLSTREFTSHPQGGMCTDITQKLIQVYFLQTPERVLGHCTKITLQQQEKEWVQHLKIQNNSLNNSQSPSNFNKYTLNKNINGTLVFVRFLHELNSIPPSRCGISGHIKRTPNR